MEFASQGVGEVEIIPQSGGGDDRIPAIVAFKMG
jgi:hypothetical protein